MISQFTVLYLSLHYITDYGYIDVCTGSDVLENTHAQIKATSPAISMDDVYILTGVGSEVRERNCWYIQ